MAVKLCLLGSVRSKKNSKRPVQVGKAGSKRLMLIPSKAYKTWETRVRAEALAQLPRDFRPFSGPVAVKMTAYYKGHRPDLSGAEESCGDMLEGIAFETDRQIESWDGSRMIHDLKNPRTILEITEFNRRNKDEY